MITHWVGEAYNRLSGEKYASSRYRCFEKTGCLVTADGTGDDKIQPEGLPGYSIPPPLPVIGPENPLDLPTPELSATSEEDDDNDEDEQYDTEEDVDENERVDNVKDRIYEHAIINRKIRAFYDDWHTGKIMWYNTKLNEYRVMYEDSSEDYITLHDINGIDMILIN